MLIDSTLREGAQMFGVYFSDQLRRKILESLLRAGIDEVEIGWAGQEGLSALLRQARGIDPKDRCKLTVWSPLRSMNLRQLADLGVRRIHFGVPVSDAHIAKRLRTDRTGVLERLRQVLEEAARFSFTYLSVGLEDVSRADRDFALEAALVVQEYGGDRIRLSDSVGLLTPLETADLVRCFTTRTRLAVGFHGHNDFGMATANAVTALGAGAHCVDVSVLGIGERAGIAALEEVAGHLNVRKNTEYDQLEMARLARLVGKAAGIPIARNKALLGKDIFACETGLHVHGLAADPTLFEPFAPESLALDRKLAVGMKSGKASVAVALQRLGVRMDGWDAEQLTRQVRTLSKNLARPLHDNELLSLLPPQSRPAQGKGLSSPMSS